MSEKWSSFLQAVAMTLFLLTIAAALAYAAAYGIDKELAIAEERGRLASAQQAEVMSRHHDSPTPWPNSKPSPRR